MEDLSLFVYMEGLRMNRKSALLYSVCQCVACADSFFPCSSCSTTDRNGDPEMLSAVGS